MDDTTWHLVVLVLTIIGSTFKIDRRLKNMEKATAALPAVVEEVAALNVRVGVLEDYGPVLR